MYFDFEDYRPDIFPVGRALTRLEVVLLSIIFHLVMVIHHPVAGISRTSSRRRS
jgi:hypothetical protein